jgi:hypothetical protein
MRGDFTRSTFHPVDHYSGVLLQQGRVQVDADWNEQVDIVRHRDETTAIDMVGSCGGPLHDAGFALTCQGGDILAGCTGNEIRIEPGRYYVDGVLCQNDEAVALANQPDLPGVPLPTAPGAYLAYLDVWQRHITSFERPSIREIALGGPDTATRSRTVWQVRLLPVADSDTCLDFEAHDGAPWMPSGDESTGMLSAQGAPQEIPPDDCLVPAGAGYRRIENQLYRVEIHEEGALGTATYKWSRDNGSVLAGLSDIDGMVITIDASKDEQLAFADATFVELSDEGRTLRGEPGILVHLSLVEGDRLTVQAWPGGVGPTMAEFGNLPSVRRWEAVPTATQTPFADLEDGVQASFQSGTYRTGDYWLIPARTLDGSVEWPVDAVGDPIPERRHGIEHRYCPVALLELTGAGAAATWTLKSDCRRLFPPLTELTELFYVGGDGQEAMPDTADLTQVLPLDKPLEVGVATGSHPVAGATVHFEVLSGTGQLGGVDGAGNVSTDIDGIADCAWSIDSTSQSQQVEATLLDAEGERIGLPVRFTANLSVASEVAYDPGTCVSLQQDRTVQAAIARLADVAGIRYVGGDGQSGMPGATLRDLIVGVSSLCGPVADATVTFEVTLGAGTLQGGPDTKVDVATTPEGLAACEWTLDDDTSTQQVTATLVDAQGRTVMDPPSVTFTAMLSVADQVAYDPSECDVLADVETVQGAIDRLCSAAPGETEPGIHIKAVTLLDDPPVELGNDTAIAAGHLARGIGLLCDAPLDKTLFERSPDGRPAAFVTLDLPYPLDDAEQSLWNTDDLLGFRPTVLDGSIQLVKELEIQWFPSDRTAGWLADQLMPTLFERGREEPVLAHLTLRGNFLWAVDEDALVYIDGDAFGEPVDDHTGLRLPSGDGRRGGDFEMWFWLVE